MSERAQTRGEPPRPGRDGAEDRSNGYDENAAAYIAGRGESSVGASVVRAWASGLPPGGSILDLGCGHGVPIASLLVANGFAVWGVDASPRMVAAFRERLPRSPVACEPVETSGFFDRTFDGIVTWGLMFLLPADVQVSLLPRVAAALAPGGRFLFTAPAQRCTWLDSLTGRESRSLGRSAYRAELDAAGFALVGEHRDEGDNHYYEAVLAQI